MYWRSPWFRVLGLSIALGVVIVGPFRIIEIMYRIGLYPAVSEREVVAALSRRGDIDAITCQRNVAGWDYVCEYVQRTPSATTTHRDGIRTSWLTPIASQSALKLDGPIQSPDEHARWVQDEYKKLIEPVNLRTASVKELRRIPMVDSYVAEQIYAGVQSGAVHGVDDLLKVKGIDQPTFRVMRPHLRWE